MIAKVFKVLPGAQHQFSSEESGLYLELSWARSIGPHPPVFGTDVQTSFASTAMTIESHKCVHLWKNRKVDTSAVRWQLWSLKISGTRRTSLYSFIIWFHLVKMPSRCPIMYQECVHNLTCGLTGISLQQLVLVVVVASKGPPDQDTFSRMYFSMHTRVKQFWTSALKHCCDPMQRSNARTGCCC